MGRNYKNLLKNSIQYKTIKLVTVTKTIHTEILFLLLKIARRKLPTVQTHEQSK